MNGVGPRHADLSRTLGDGAERNSVGWGVVGAGWIATDHLVPALDAVPGARLVGVTDPVAGRAEAAAGAARARRSLADLLEDPTVEVVHVATPNHTHGSVIRACLDAGRHVVCEKPLTTEPDEAGELHAHARRVDRWLLTAFDQRHHPAHRTMGRLVAAGEIGQVVQVAVRYACWVDQTWATDNWRIDGHRSGGGAAIDLAPHVIDLVSTLVGHRWDALQVMLQHAVHPYARRLDGVDDGAVLVGSLGEVAAVAQVAYCWPETLPRRRIEVTGTGGALTATDTMGQTPGGRLTRTSAETGDTSEVAFDGAGDPFVGQVEWVDAVVRGEATACPDTDLAHHLLLLDALARADDAATRRASTRQGAP